MTEASEQAPLSAAEIITSDLSGQKAELADLQARATQQYSLKHYTEASDLYSQAVQLQAEINGSDLAPENAELLYLYGKSLYQVGVSKSDVLGGTVTGEADAAKAKEIKGKTGESSSSAGLATVVEGDEEEEVAAEVVTKVVESKDGATKQEAAGAPKPYFQITGDDNLYDSDEDEEAEADGPAPEGEGEQEEDDLVASWNVLDMARLLFTRQLEETSVSKGKSTTISPEIRHIKERLADTHDLLAEISLEGERFPAAVSDFKEALTLKRELYDQANSVMAEAHYKLSLALEFAAVTPAAPVEGTDEQAPPPAEAEATIDEAGREEAAKQMEEAIESCRARVKKEETLLKTDPAAASSHKPKIDRASIDDLKDMISDMEQRLTDLRAPPVTMSAAEQAVGPADASALNGILGSILGESPEEQKARLEEAVKGANDLSGLVRRKKVESKEGGGSNGVKRKAEGDLSPAKKVKVEGVAEE